MHREKQILLGFLGLLCGGFVAVLGAKLFIPRPPAGAGPDIDAPPALVAPQLVVEPPALSGVADRQAAPHPGSDLDAAPPATDRYATGSGFARRDDRVAPAAFLEESADVTAGGAAPAADVAAAPAPEASGPPVDVVRGTVPAEREVTNAGPVEPVANPLRSRPTPSAAPGPPPGIASGTDAAPLVASAGTAPGPSATPLTAPTGAAARRAPLPAPQAAPSAAPLHDEHVTIAGDSWWSIAERAYGEGRYYRALYAWNRTVNPQVSLLPGTRLEIPPVSRLEAAWPRLVPRQ